MVQGLLEVCVWWGGGAAAVYVHLGFSSRSELILVGAGAEGGSTQEGRRVRSGWLATCPDDSSRFVCVFLLVGGEGVGVCEKDGVGA